MIANLPTDWSATTPDETDVPELTELLRRHEQMARGWSSASPEGVAPSLTRQATGDNIVIRGPGGLLHGWGSAHDRAAGRVLLSVVVEPGLDDADADATASLLLSWGDEASRLIGVARDLAVQQIDAGTFAEDHRQQRWLASGGYQHVRTWWQMSRPVTPDEADLDPGCGEAITIRRVRREGSGKPEEHDLHLVHNVLEESFADHFNSHTETYEEFLSRLREDPGHRWDHWWIAELAEDGRGPTPAGTLVGAVKEGSPGEPDGSYVEYLGVLKQARGRGVAKSLLRTMIADAAARGRDRVGLEVDADSPTGADHVYLSMGFTTSYMTQSWHREVTVAG